MDRNNGYVKPRLAKSDYDWDKEWPSLEKPKDAVPQTTTSQKPMAKVEKKSKPQTLKQQFNELQAENVALRERMYYKDRLLIEGMKTRFYHVDPNIFWGETPRRLMRWKACIDEILAWDEERISQENKPFDPVVGSGRPLHRLSAHQEEQSGNRTGTGNHS